ncbi:hypothetical protein [Bordetella bronchiseptica]|uniref:hypothetical protein n=1 Tax=Bordetella bronchiseptica TaxID=518 RepID=UPI000461AD39|nr:hypothetical protein [Bordetella bronchiseptica]KDC47983.1 hypothetical protein L509_4163 [Bordetella bronchiseptica M85/00/2]
MYVYQDDPYRTAPPHCAPGEQEPEEVEDVSSAQAIRDMLAVLRGNEHEAHGYDAQGFAEQLHNYLIRETEDEISLAFAILAPFSPEGIAFRKRWMDTLYAMVNDRVLP